jgi:hypothetical protein
VVDVVNANHGWFRVASCDPCVELQNNARLWDGIAARFRRAAVCRM